MKFIFLFTLMLILVLTFTEASAQCAMCRATVENNVADGDDRLGVGLNFGILYLLVMPYLLAGIIGYLWYRNSKRSNERKIKIQGIIRSKMSPMQGG